MNPSYASAWVPKSFNDGGIREIYMMSAKHRGDMYHVAAAVIAVGRSLILHDCSNDTKDLVDYLFAITRMLNKDVFQVPWDYKTLTGKTKPTSVVGCHLNGKSITLDSLEESRKKIRFFAEGGATWEFSQTIRSAYTLAQDIAPKMADLGTHASWLHDKFADLKLFPSSPGKGAPIMLVLHRDTGKELGGAYPELDSGEALWDIINAIDKIPDATGMRKLSSVSCGDVKDTKGRASIGKYWEKLRPLAKETKLPQRTVEAAFMQWAFQKEYYDMAIAFRSGSLDLFTFLGIPTVSISLRNLVGEERHEILALEAYKRVNVQYDQPRHNVTAWVVSRDPNVILLQSPYWLNKAPNGAKPRPTDLTDNQKKVLLAKDAGGLAAFDKRVFEIGLRIAAERFLKGWGKTAVQILSCGNIITTKDAKRCYPVNEEDSEKYFELLKQEDKADLKGRRTKNAELQEPDGKLEVYLDASNSDWPNLQFPG